MGRENGGKMGDESDDVHHFMDMMLLKWDDSSGMIN